MPPMILSDLPMCASYDPLGYAYVYSEGMGWKHQEKWAEAAGENKGLNGDYRYLLDVGRSLDLGQI